MVTAISNKKPNRTLAELVVGNMREIGAPQYDEEELDFAREIAETIPPDERRETLRRANSLGLSLERLETSPTSAGTRRPWSSGRPAPSSAPRATRGRSRPSAALA
jgi:aminobenzoyl-glutamate utilization protein B